MKNNSPLNIPQRTSKNREVGITSIHDVSLTRSQLRAILEDHYNFLDIAKLGVGSAYVTPYLEEKIQLYTDAKVEVYFGGTLFEKYFSQNKLEAYLAYLDTYHIKTIEVSCGTIDISLKKRADLVKQLSKDYTVYAEVGSKDTETIMPPSQWIDELNTLLAAGAKYVITEGRNSGTAGVYRTSGELRTGLVADIINQVPVEKIIFEAPSPKSQMYFINQVGPDVNLGNVNPYDLLLLEAQRCGLRSETFYISTE